MIPATDPRPVRSPRAVLTDVIAAALRRRGATSAQVGYDQARGVLEVRCTGAGIWPAHVLKIAGDAGYLATDRAGVVLSCRMGPEGVRLKMVLVRRAEDRGAVGAEEDALARGRVVAS